MRAIAIIIFSIIICSCSPQEDPCERALAAADLLLNEHVKFEIAIADVSQAYKARDTALAARHRENAERIARDLFKLGEEYSFRHRECRKSR